MGYSAAAAIAAAGNAAVSNQQAKSDQSIRNEKNRKQLLEKQKADNIKSALAGQESTKAGSRIAAEKQVLARRGAGSYAKSKSGGSLG